MRILHILSQTPDFTGSGKYLQEIVRRSRARGHDNFLVAGVPLGYAPPQDVIEPERCELVSFSADVSADLDFPVAGMSDVMPYESSVFSCLGPDQLRRYEEAFRRAIGAAVERFKPDLLHTHHLWIASAAAREVAPGLPLVTTCHGTCLRQHALCPDLGRSLVPSLARIDRAIALFPEQQAEIAKLLAMPSERIDVLGGGFDEACFLPGERAATGRVELLYAGKLNRAKGVPWLLRTMNQRVDSLADLPIHLHLAGGGSGPEAQECLALAAALGERHPGSCTVHGTLSHAELAVLMGRADVFVLPSFFEGLPLVLLEALACGCRIVTTDLPGARQLFSPLQDDMVGLVELPQLEGVDRPREADWPLLERRLEAALRRMTELVLTGAAPDRAYAARVTEPYTWTRIFESLEAIYAQALAQGPKTG